LQWLTLVVVLLLPSSGIFAERVDPVSNAVGSLDTASPVANVRNGSPTNRLPSPSRAAAVLLWNDRALELCVKYRRNPLRVARTLAVLHVAIYDAVAAAKNSDEQAQAIAAATAAGAVLDYLFPLETPGRFEAMAWAIYAGAAAAPGASRETLGDARRVGQLAAERAIAHALRDHSDLVWDPRERPVPAPGRWRAAPPLYAYDPLEPLAASWATWVLKDGAEVQPPPPVVYDTPAYWRETEEVLAVSRALTAEQKRIAEDWNLDRGSVTPAGVWNLKARNLIQAGDLDTLRTAQVLAVLNMAMADAAVASWRAKFTHWTQRPVTAIRERFDPEWLPLILTPPFPSYVSTHATLSGAAAEVLAAFFPQAAGPLQAAAEEAALSRLYGGIHFRSDNDAGLQLGRRIGRLVLERLNGQ
jgi:membrane-associated phospholipid phosphatase